MTQRILNKLGANGARRIGSADRDELVNAGLLGNEAQTVVVAPLKHENVAFGVLLVGQEEPDSEAPPQAMEVSTVLARSLEALRPIFTPGYCCTNCGSNWRRTAKRKSKPRAPRNRSHGHQSPPSLCRVQPSRQPNPARRQQNRQPQPSAESASRSPAAASPACSRAASLSADQPSASAESSRSPAAPSLSRTVGCRSECRLFGLHTLRRRGCSRLRVSQPRQLISRTIIRYALASRAGQNACAAPLGTDRTGCAKRAVLPVGVAVCEVRPVCGVGPAGVGPARIGPVCGVGPV